MSSEPKTIIDPRAALNRIDGILAKTPIPGATRETHVAIVQDLAALRILVDAWEVEQAAKAKAPAQAKGAG